MALTVREALLAVGEPCSDLLDRFFTRDESYKTISEAARDPARHDRQPHLPLPREASRADRGKKRRRRPVWSSMSANAWNEERLGELLRLLRPAPTGWVAAAA